MLQCVQTYLADPGDFLDGIKIVRHVAIDDEEKSTSSGS